MRALLLSEVDTVWVPICGDVCPFCVDKRGGDATVEKVSVTWGDTELMVSDPPLGPMLQV